MSVVNMNSYRFTLSLVKLMLHVMQSLTRVCVSNFSTFGHLSLELYSTAYCVFTLPRTGLQHGPKERNTILCSTSNIFCKNLFYVIQKTYGEYDPSTAIRAVGLSCMTMRQRTQKNFRREQLSMAFHFVRRHPTILGRLQTASHRVYVVHTRCSFTTECLSYNKLIQKIFEVIHEILLCFFVPCHKLVRGSVNTLYLE